MLCPLYLNPVISCFKLLVIKNSGLKKKKKIYHKESKQSCVSLILFPVWQGQCKVTPLLLSRDTVVTKNKLETSLIIVSSGQRLAKGKGHRQGCTHMLESIIGNWLIERILVDWILVLFFAPRWVEGFIPRETIFQ